MLLWLSTFISWARPWLPRHQADLPRLCFGSSLCDIWLFRPPETWIFISFLGFLACSRFASCSLPGSFVPIPVSLFGEPVDVLLSPWPTIYILWDSISASGSLLGRPWASVWEATCSSGPSLWPHGDAHSFLHLCRISQGSMLAPVCLDVGSMLSPVGFMLLSISIHVGA